MLTQGAIESEGYFRKSNHFGKIQNFFYFLFFIFGRKNRLSNKTLA